MTLRSDATTPEGDAGNWRAQITALCGGATIGEMHRCVGDQGWSWTMGTAAFDENFSRVVGVEGITAAVFSPDDRFTPPFWDVYECPGNAKNPEEALALAILAAVAATGEGR